MIFEIISKIVSIAIALIIVCMFLVSIAYYLKFKVHSLAQSKVQTQALLQITYQIPPPLQITHQIPLQITCQIPLQITYQIPLLDRKLQ